MQVKKMGCRMNLPSLLIILAAALPLLLRAKNVMPWMCLEFCEESTEQINSNLQQLADHHTSISKVSFEKYTLGPNSELVDNELTEVNSQLLKLGFQTWPLLSSYPHPPEFINWMRQVFRNPQPFIDSCISEAEKFGYSGYNLDWEPTDGEQPVSTVTDADGLAYAQFIDIFASKLHEANLGLTVDVATWSPAWNYTALAQTGADSFVSMGTYTATDSSFSSQLQLMIDSFGPERSGVGLETVNATSLERLPLSEVAWRFDQIRASGARELCMWKMPVPPGWWPMVDAFARQPEDTQP